MTPHPGLIIVISFLLVTTLPLTPAFTAAPFPSSLLRSTQLGVEGLAMEDKYIGLLLAVSSSVAIGTSFIITKKVGFLIELFSLSLEINSRTLFSWLSFLF